MQNKITTFKFPKNGGYLSLQMNSSYSYLKGMTGTSPWVVLSSWPVLLYALMCSRRAEKAAGAAPRWRRRWRWRSQAWLQNRSGLWSSSWGELSLANCLWLHLYGHLRSTSLWSANGCDTGAFNTPGWYISKLLGNPCTFLTTIASTLWHIGKIDTACMRLCRWEPHISEIWQLMTVTAFPHICRDLAITTQRGKKIRCFNQLPRWWLSSCVGPSLKHVVLK